jgi:hypothetical protein
MNADIRLDVARLTKMLVRLPDSGVSPAVVKILCDTQIPRHRVAQEHPNSDKGPAGLRVLPPMGLGQELSSRFGPLTSRDLREALARTEAASPVMSYETMLTPLVL